jgi:hypothetical protein
MRLRSWIRSHGGWPEVMRRNHDLALRGRDLLCDALDIAPPAPDEMLGAMAAVPLPDGMPKPAAIIPADPLQDKLLFTHGIEVPINALAAAAETRAAHLSAQLYNELADYEKLAAHCVVSGTPASSPAGWAPSRRPLPGAAAATPPGQPAGRRRSAALSCTSRAKRRICA